MAPLGYMDNEGLHNYSVSHGWIKNRLKSESREEKSSGGQTLTWTCACIEKREERGEK